MNLKNKNVVVYGLGRSGKAVVDFLCENGATVFVYDDDITKTDFYQNNNRKITILKNLCELNLKIMDIMVISPGVSVYAEGVKLASLLGVKVYGELEFANSYINKKVIAVTGTNGKSTTVSIIKNIFDCAKKNTILAGNIGLPLIQEVHKKTKGYILEVSSFMLESIEKFKPHIACILNISKDHLDRHFTFENYFKTKLKIVSNMTPKDYLVLNYEDKNLCQFYTSKPRPKIVWFSSVRQVEGAYIYQDKIMFKKGKKDIFICNKQDIPLLGTHNVENVLCAVCVAMLSKLKVKDIVDGIKSFNCLEHRLEFVQTVRGVDYYNDSKSTTVDSTIKAMNSFDKSIILLLGGSDKGDDFDALAKHLSNFVKISIVYGETKNKIIASFNKYHREYIEANSLQDALTKIDAISEYQDIVLLSPACASFDEFSNYEQRGKFFKNFVRELNEKQ